ncbi:MAG: transcription factor S [Candidatus Bathyarchaeia archaeon]
MEFCPTCEKKMTVQRTADGSVYICPVCKYKKTTNKPAPTRKIVRQNTEEPIVVIGKEDANIKTNPTASIACPKCDNNLAYTWQVQTRAGDEGATQFFRCTKCNFTFRLYT